jgi:imidazolonepropionase-like amidohydrolase
VGQIAPGFSADLALFAADDVRELPYWYGDNRCIATWVRGRICHPSPGDAVPGNQGRAAVPALTE